MSLRNRSLTNFLSPLSVVEARRAVTASAQVRFLERAMISEQIAAVAFPMLYVNSVPHQGHGALAARCELMVRFLSLRRPMKLHVGFHCTGRPVVTSVELFHARSPRQIQTIQEACRICDRRPAVTEDSWVQLIADAGRTVFEQMGLTIDRSKYHMTARFDPAYETFVARFFSLLKERGYLVRKDHHTLWSDRTGAPVGDHELRRGQSARIVYTTLNVVHYDAETDIVVAGGPLQTVTHWPAHVSKYSTGARPLWVSPYLVPTLQQLGFMLQEGLDTLALGGREDVIVPHPGEDAMEAGPYGVILEPVVTREGEVAKVKLVRDAWHIDYGNPEWKELTRKHILKKRLAETVRNDLLHNLEHLKAWSIERNISIGTSLKLQADKFVITRGPDALIKNIDSLSDSTLFMLYAFYGAEALDRPVTDRVLYITAKDLVANHILFHLYSEALLQIDFTEIQVLGWLSAGEGKKISKSEGDRKFLSTFLHKYGPEMTVAVLGTALKPSKDAFVTEKGVETISKLLKLVRLGPKSFTPRKRSLSVEALFYSKVAAIVQAYESSELGTLPGLFFSLQLPGRRMYEGYTQYLAVAYACFGPFIGATGPDPYTYLRTKAPLFIELGLDAALLRDAHLLENLLRTADSIETQTLSIPLFLSAYKPFIQTHTGKVVCPKDGIKYLEGNVQVVLSEH